VIGFVAFHFMFLWKRTNMKVFVFMLINTQKRLNKK
jgi:hypothetical protein